MEHESFSTQDIDELSPVAVRKLWPNEASDFTPWLLNHPEVLAKALEIDIELDQAEHSVGGFSLDLIGRDLSHDAVLIVENQLEKTDHGHLGQLITYAAGTDAATVVWLATKFRDEYRQALDWLNEKTDEDTRFFGIELRVVRIGSSNPAVVLDVVAKPNEWQKHVRAISRAAVMTEKAHNYQKFWEQFLEELHDRHPEWTNVKRPSTQGWMRFTSPVKGTFINPSFARNDRLRHEVYIDTGHEDRNSAIYERLVGQKSVIEDAYGRSLEWEKMKGKRAFRIAEYTYGSLGDESSWPRHIDWFLDAGERLRRALAAIE